MESRNHLNGAEPKSQMSRDINFITMKKEEKIAASAPFTFRTPAGIQDFGAEPAKQNAMNTLWSQNLDGFIQQGMQSNQWNTTNTPPTTNYYNPVADNPASSLANVQWGAFPGRLAYNFPTASQNDLNKMADTGVMPGQISDDPCNQSSGTLAPYFPYGPRGWQDEYCEWAITRNAAGKITRIDFTCENPEYWNSLWLVDPNKVLELYQSILDKPQITLADLSLPGAVNPQTGGPIYNPLNKWNSGTDSNTTSGGAIHLTSTPNTIQTEIGLATAATVLRNNPGGGTSWQSSEYNELLCDAQYGQKHRNSDPNIGGTVNSFVNSGNVVTLADPPGLYIQMPDFSNYVTPDSTNAASFWTIKRGSETLKTQGGVSMPGNFILHAVFEVPAGLPYVVGDIKIAGKPISWGSQVAATFKMQIVASAYQGTVPSGYPAVGSTSPANTLAQPEQLFYKDYFNAMYGTLVPNPSNHPIPLLSNSTFIPAKINVGTTSAQMVLTCATCTAVSGQPNTYPSVTFEDPNITAQVTSVMENISYAVPGNSSPSNSTALFLTVSVGQNTAIGIHNLYLTNVGQSLGPPMKALLNVAPIEVIANVKWQKTGVNIQTGTQVTITYKSGLWTANPNVNGGDLYNAAGNPAFIPAKSGYTMPGADEGAMIGRVGSSVFLVGMGVTVPTSLSGELELCINDDLNGIYGVGFADNQGAIIMEVSVG